MIIKNNTQKRVEPLVIVLTAAHWQFLEQEVVMCSRIQHQQSKLQLFLFLFFKFVCNRRIFINGAPTKLQQHAQAKTSARSPCHRHCQSGAKPRPHSSTEAD